MTEHSNELYEAIAAEIELLQGVDVSDEVIEMVLVAITVGVVSSVPGAFSSCITLVHGTDVVTIASTEHTAGRVGELQAKHGMGPCLDVERDHHIVRVDDYETDQRWSAFAGDVLAQTPIRSSLIFRLSRDGGTVGTLDVHADQPNAFDSDAETIGMAFAAQAASALHSGARQIQFSHALASRDVLGQAKGILMERYDISGEEAFDLLRKLSQDTNTKAAVLARRLVDADHPSIGGQC